MKIKRKNLKSILSNQLAKVFLVCAFVVICIFLFTANLQTIPTSVHGDEGETALQALEILKGNVGIIGVGWFDLPLLSFVPHAATMAIVGPNIIGDRLGSVIFGLLTIPVFYLFTRELFKIRVALISTLLLATSHMWIALSRLGITYVQATFLMLSALYFLFKGMRQMKGRYFLMSGIFIGLSMYSYYSARILPLLIIICVIPYLLKREKFKHRVLHVILTLFSALIIFAPQAVFYLNHPETFTSRTKMVYVFSEIGRQWTQYNKSDPEILLEQTKKTFNFFAGDNSTQYGYKGQLLDYATIFFFGIGLIYSLSRITSRKHTFLLAWLGISFIGQILTTIPTPFFLPRFVVGLPVLYILIGQGINKFYEFVAQVKRPNLARITISIVLIYIIGVNIYTYFVAYPKQTVGDPNARAATKISSYINSLNETYAVYFVTEPLLYPDFGTIRFLAPGKPAVLGTATYGYKSQTQAVYVVYPHRLSELWTLRQNNPNGDILEFKDTDGHIQFYVYKIK